MGIDNLSSFVDKHFSDIAEEIHIPKGSWIYVDGNNIFSVLMTKSDNYSDLMLRFERIFKQYLSHGVSLKVFFDGCSTKMRNSRIKRKSKLITHMFQKPITKPVRLFVKRAFACAKLISLHAIMELYKKLVSKQQEGGEEIGSLEFVQSPRDVDEFIMVEAGKNPKCVGILSTDTDFLILNQHHHLFIFQRFTPTVKNGNELHMLALKRDKLIQVMKAKKPYSKYNKYFGIETPPKTTVRKGPKYWKYMEELKAKEEAAAKLKAESPASEENAASTTTSVQQAAPVKETKKKEDDEEDEEERLAKKSQKRDYDKEYAVLFEDKSAEWEKYGFDVKVVESMFKSRDLSGGFVELIVNKTHSLHYLLEDYDSPTNSLMIWRPVRQTIYSYVLHSSSTQEQTPISVKEFFDEVEEIEVLDQQVHELARKYFHGFTSESKTSLRKMVYLALLSNFEIPFNILHAFLQREGVHELNSSCSTLEEYEIIFCLLMTTIKVLQKTISTESQIQEELNSIAEKCIQLRQSLKREPMSAIIYNPQTDFKLKLEINDETKSFFNEMALFERGILIAKFLNELLVDTKSSTSQERFPVAFGSIMNAFQIYFIHFFFPQHHRFTWNPKAIEKKQ